MIACRSVLAALCLFAFVATGRAAPSDPGVVPSVVAVPAQVTLARGGGPDGLSLVTYAAYLVTIANNTTNTLNRVFFNAAAVNVGSSEALAFQGTVPVAAGCIGIGTAQLECSLSSLGPGASTSFHAVVTAPASGTRIDLNWTAGGFEGNGVGNGCCSKSGTASTALVDPATDSSFQTSMTSFVLPGGGTFFTGAEAVSTTADGWTTIVRVPAFTSLPQTTAAVAESRSAESCAPYALACFSTALTIPGTFDLQPLEIILRWDSAYFKLGGTKPADVKLFYDASPRVPPAGTLYPHQLRLCTVDAADTATNPGGVAPIAGRPCLDGAPRKLGKQDTPNKALWGDLEIRALATDNGVYKN